MFKEIIQNQLKEILLQSDFYFIGKLSRKG